MAEYIEREAAIESFRKNLDGGYVLTDDAQTTHILQSIPAADVRPVPAGGIGEMSDGYHTFNGLYYQRMVLFAALVKAHKDEAWKSWKHEDGELCFGGGWFIVGIDTPQGSYTYHYDEMYWNMFECEELPVAKHWDGHTEEDVTRLLTLDVRPVVLCKECVHYEMGVCLKIYDDGAANKDAWQERKPDDFCSYGEDRNVPTKESEEVSAVRCWLTNGADMREES